MVLKIGSSWILINVPRDVPCQILHCWVYPVAPFLKWPKYGLLWSKHGPHMVLKIGSSWILINVPRDVPCQISHCLIYPVAPFPRNGQNKALLWPKHGQHMVWPFMAKTWSSPGPWNWFFLNLNQCAQGCSMPNFTLLGVSCSPLF